MNRALVKNPNDRYQTSREMAIDFFLGIGMNAEAQTIYETAREITRSERTGLGTKNTKLDIGVPQNEKSVQVPAPAAKPSRKIGWIGAVIGIFVCLLVGALGGMKLITALPMFSKATATLSPEVIPPTGSTSSTEPIGPASAEGMIKISSGSYEVGVAAEDEYHSAVQNISLNDFWIDQYQITNSKYQLFLTETGGPTPVVWPAGGNQPVRGVSWDQASAYCGWVSKRLPSEAEWEAAGRGPNANPPLYPWGTDPTNGGQTLSMPDQDTYDVGSQSFNVSPSGLYDMVGNVWEWVGEPYGSVPEGFKILRGGRFGIPQDLAYRLSVTPNDERYVKYAGFRCATDKVQ
jgi:formylglycine-generating enzyme required for sulfatase activity